MSIVHWPKDERPREKLLRLGANALSDAELLAILLRHGVQGQSALGLARNLIHDFGGLNKVLNANAKTFCAHHGLGPAKFAHLQASLEIARRHYEKPLSRCDVLKHAGQTQRFLIAKLRDLEHEVFSCLFLNTQNHVIHYEILFHGTLRYANVHPRELIKHTLKHNAASVILAHNHPSGDATPSEADKAITRELKNALEYIDVNVLDHIIVAQNNAVSFAEMGLL